MTQELFGGTPAPLSAAHRSICDERIRQVVEERWNAESDDQHHTGAMAMAAACYALASVASVSDETEPGLLQRLWPWARRWWKPRSARENLVRAGALIVAEIERLDRLSGGDAA